MGKKKQPDSFWLSYSDLMTSLFFIMLVLFVVCIVVLKSAPDDVSTLKAQIVALKNENAELRKRLESSEKQVGDLQRKIGEYEVQKEDYERLLNLDKSFKGLSQSSSLQYIESNKSFIAKDFEGIEIFESGKADIKPEYLRTVDKVGKDLQALLKELNKNNPNKISYLLVIEGNTANTYDHKFDPNNEGAYNLSYQRAMALYKRWLRSGINLRQYNTEIQICGSGMNGINRDKKVEENNKRFVIQIIPKISRSE